MSSADWRLTLWRSMGMAARTRAHRCAFQRRSKKWSAAAATTVLWRTRVGRTDSSSPVSTWLAWLATKMAGASTSSRISAPRTSGEATTWARGRVTLSRSTARTRRAG